MTDLARKCTKHLGIRERLACVGDLVHGQQQVKRGWKRRISVGCNREKQRNKD